MNILQPGSWEAFRKWRINDEIIPEGVLEKILLVLKKEEEHRIKFRKICAEIHKHEFDVVPGVDAFYEFPNIYFIGGMPLQPFGMVCLGKIGMGFPHSTGTRFGEIRVMFPHSTWTWNYELLEGLHRFDEEEDLSEKDYVRVLMVKEEEMIVKEEEMIVKEEEMIDDK
tara:strand:- start:132 stop:635 length:504 start_codon:yes stop_codon:yes gene_type:complete